MASGIGRFAGLSRRTWLGLLTIGVALLAWWLLTSVTGWVSPARFPKPIEVQVALTQITTEGYGNGLLHQHIFHSLKLVLMGFAVAVLVGVPLGLLMGYSRKAESLINPAFLLLRPIPPLAWIPLAIVWLGLGDAAKILVIFVAAFVPSVINSYTGVRNIDTPVMEAAQMLGIKGSKLVFDVLIPGAFPMIFTGLRLSLQASWTTLVAAELIGALYGLGSILNQGSQDIYPAMILVAMVFVGICGAVTTAILGKIESRAMPWRRERSVA
ncbi:ABC transporter permease [Variovorax sp. PCZ-1]|uniref:ABC transporter permease n=1 Tax=Variovorax sp. PCZ-1 TaxID=2835533 RepID=UPI001BCB46A7|nr:ABC transporter permease [Variovorax sp. PCZ-1]MBS7806721.1 ABC transporter permease [Variovorax sp. PCZ-1]